MTDRRRWYVVQTRAHEEPKAEWNLQQQGFDTYTPRLRKTRRHARRVDVVPAPLFPRYMFVGMDPASQRWRAINSTFGVSRLVRHGELPTAVPDAVIDELRSFEDEDGFVRLPLPPGLRPGDMVRVTEGAFTSCLGLFEGMSDGDRVTILLDILGRKTRVVLDSASVALA
jgi:transcriptional antiterminator RfaH